MKKKSVVALLLAALLAAASACSPAPAVSTAGSQPEKVSSAGEEAAEEPDSSSGEVVVLDIFRSGTRPMNEKTEAVRQYVIDTLGVDMQMNQIAENANQQLALMITSGDMPDLMLIDYNTYLDYGQQGAFFDISQDVKDYDSLMEYVGDYWVDVTIEDGIYGVPSMLNVPTNNLTAIRKDWLDNLGLEIPETLEEWEAVMRAFTFEDPDQNGKDDTYGYSGAGFQYVSGILGAFGATSDQHYFLNVDDTVTTNAISEEYRAGLTYLNKLYEEKIMDPEFFTATIEQSQQKWGRGQFGIWPGGWSWAGNAYLRYGFEELQPDAQVEIVYPPKGENGTQGELYAAAFDSVIAFSGSMTEEKKDAGLKLLNFEATREGFYTVMFGIKDIDYETDEDGLITWYWGNNGGKDREGNEVTDMEVYKLLYNEPLQRYADSLDKSPANVLYAAATEVQYATPVRENLFAFIRTEEYLDNDAELKKFFEENSIRFIMGEKDIETEWEQYKADYLAMGGEEVRQSLLKAYNEKMGTEYTFRE